MAANDTKTVAKAPVASPKLPEEVFAVEVNNHELLKRAYDAYLANNRTSAARTLTRGEVRGGGKKPWKQKGTGRARFGSSRNPIWRGGGIVFGPRGNENYSIKIPTQAKRQAVKQALTLASQANKIHLLDVTSTGKTAEVAKFLADNSYDRKVLIVVDAKTPELIRGTNNLGNVMLISTKYLSVFHILNADHILLSPQSVPTLKSWLVKEEA